MSKLKSLEWLNTMNEWISVDDKLANNDTQVIAWVGERAITLAYCDDGYWCEHYGTRDFSKYITHWMPLPSPPSND